MKKRLWIIRVPVILIMVSMSFLAMSCSAILPSTIPYQDNVKLDMKNMPSPEESTLLFGHIYRYFKYYDQFFDEIYFAQVNPEHPAQWHTPGAYKTMYYLAPVKPGSRVRIIHWKIKGGSTIYYAYPGLGPSNHSLTFTAEKPGLQYIGSHVFADNIDYSQSFAEDDSHDELEALTYLLPLVKGSSWESVVSARIEELSK